MNTYAYALPNEMAPTPIRARSTGAAVSAVQAVLWDTHEDKARLFRLADGWRFMGFVTYEGRFIDERNQPIVRDPA
jgi:hypothetical protein